MKMSTNKNKLKQCVKGLTFNSSGFMGKMLQERGGGTSIFDPVLCELCYRWFCPPGGLIIDPFAGGSVRGIVASKLGRKYMGIDLRQEQVDANIEQAKTICTEPMPAWYIGDSREIDKILPNVKADFLFSCPPYADLERYSDDPKDISTMNYPDFLIAYREIIQKSYNICADDTFLCFVVGEARDKNGFYYGFVPDTIKAFMDAGANYYNEAILVNVIGSLPIRVKRQFTVGRKLGKTHQNVLIFCKGDPKKAVQKIGNVEFGDVPTTEADNGQASQEI